MRQGYLFAALPGAHVDGRDYIPQAVEAGAVAVLATAGTEVPDGVRLLEADESGLMFSPDAERLIDRKGRPLRKNWNPF